MAATQEEGESSEEEDDPEVVDPEPAKVAAEPVPTPVSPPTSETSIVTPPPKHCAVAAETPSPVPFPGP